MILWQPLNLIIYEIVRLLVLISWFAPLFFLMQTVTGLVCGKLRYKHHNPKKDVELIILQIPTIGNHELVNKICDTVRSYDLPIPLQCWVIIEEGNNNPYNADRVIVVPKTFKCLAHVKARALEYARRFRLQLVDTGQLTPRYVIVQSDDDSLVSRELIMEALNVDADIVIGTIKPRKTTTLGLILDYERPYTCMHTCIFFANIGHPIYGHGESQIYTYNVERVLDYEFKPLNNKKLDNVPVMGNEDMYWLHKAELAGFKIYKSTKTVLISPPLTFKDAVKQRRRWLWGNFNIVYIKRMLPFSHAMRFVFAHLCAFLFYPFSQLGIVLSVLGFMHLTWEQGLLALVSMICWYALRIYSISHVMGWKHGLIGGAITKITTLLNFIVLTIGVLQGDPKRFEVIKKV